ncbi:MAG: hypothetical protein US57_C0007G0020 [Candidatus Moranbacteria bacterium GW2011_GWC2_37_73]|nr:MAG: protein of unknown function DUF1428 [Parcubacteria group bacterium GW2011_GWC1_36_108]KKQ00598.1 MAG: hypothetical protein US09_C0009G0019 [Candidatus Moranbacteria bacterium GW2011_GWD1_36_198]KKQ02019.1 MAG: hypothetical protein US10_C0006G0017 [Candidatus Moranbacteria bacterium GW2011_GWD2_36_198]KKQ39876.1 MAG: hypothetical protein US57_C0007G0020 [Candidatus Moranbacteria bacterium GW2011_GWC2_37_73]HAS00204.1 DUF1428 domain-containing protein [Candidatus Moranbacteria bacterium]
MSKYVDGYVLPVSIKKLSEYKKMALPMAKLMKKYGALDYMECVGDDLNPNMMGMKILKFPQMVKIKKGETVVFSFAVFKSKAHRDKVNALVMKDPAMNDPKYANMPMPFDMKRMAYGGFKTIVNL